MINNFILKIKNRENPVYAFLYRLAKFCMTWSIPVIKPIHLPLYTLDQSAKNIVRSLVNGVWSVPLFKARCAATGKALNLPNGIPLIVGSHLKIFLGDHVSISRSTIGASKVYNNPILTIGNNTSIGYGTTISVSKEITIGADCRISTNCLIMDSDDHPIDPEKRRRDSPVELKDIKPVHIGNNVWIGAYTAILKGVTIGDNAVIGTHSVVTTDVPANCLFTGVPAKLVRHITHAE